MHTHARSHTVTTLTPTAYTHTLAHTTESKENKKETKTCQADHHEDDYNFQ